VPNRLSRLEQRRQLPVGALWRRGEVEVQPLLLGVADEVPVVGEAAAIAAADVFEDDLAGHAVAGRRLEEIDETLRGQAPRDD